MHKGTCKYEPYVVSVGHPKIHQASLFLLYYITETKVWTLCWLLKNEALLNSDDLYPETITIFGVI